jgi:hypothetical protein
MGPVTPYTPKLAGREPIAAMRDSRRRFAALSERWSLDDLERSRGEGKWNPREILVHLAQTEIGLGARARLAVSIPDYVAQPFDQDAWMVRERSLGGGEAIAALLALMQMNIEFFAGLSDADRAVAFTHPEYGSITVDWIIYQMAGHHIHHLEQLEQIGKAGNREIGKSRSDN